MTRPRLAVALFVAVSLISCGTDDAEPAAPPSDTDSTEQAGPATPDADPTGVPPCDEVQVAVVTDIDNTLTTSNEEFIAALSDPEHVTEPRPDAAATMSAYAERGYWVIYITARPETVEAHGLTGREMTEQWLAEQGFPVGERTRLELAPDLEATADAATFKSTVLNDLREEGFDIAFAYGDAESDFEAWSVVPVPAERNFSLGERAGHEGTTGIDSIGFTEHLEEIVSPLDQLCAD